MKLCVFIIATVLLVSDGLAFAQQRIWLKDTQINGQPVHLCFDTDSDANFLTEPTARRLGLNLPTGLFAGYQIWTNENVILKRGEIQEPQEFFVLNIPHYTWADFDGIIAWWSIRQNILQINSPEQNLELLPVLPQSTAHWTQYSLVANSKTVAFSVPKNKKGRAGIIAIDTGSAYGVALPPDEWRQWRKAHPKAPLTLRTYSSPNDSFVVAEEAWADEITIGNIDFKGVPIIQAPPSEKWLWGKKYLATLGLAALNDLHVIIDHDKSIYLQTNYCPINYNHNRLGAVFVPTQEYTNRAVARVIKGSPADEAGICNGDILLQVDEVPVKAWTDDWISRFSQPPGSQIHLMLTRKGEKYETTATLRQIIPPN